MTVTKLAVAARPGSPIAEQTSLKAIDTLIKAAALAYGKAQDKVQAAALAIMVHAKDYGDCTKAKVLARAVPARERNSLIGWFSMFSPIGVALGKTAKEDAARFIKPESKNYNPFDIDAAKAHNWWDDPAGTNPEPKALNTLADFWSAVDAMLAKAIKDAAKEGEKQKYTDADREIVAKDAAAVRTMVNNFRVKAAATAQANADKGKIDQPDAAAAMAAAG